MEAAMYCVELDDVPQVITEGGERYVKRKHDAWMAALRYSRMYSGKVFCVCSKPKRRYRNKQELVTIDDVTYKPW